MAAGGPDPQRLIYQGRYLPKVFIAYPRKPTFYEQRAEPDGARDNPVLRQLYEEEVARLGRDAELEVEAHKETVCSFARFLQSQSIAVAYDLSIRDRGEPNVMSWCEAQIADSDYLILVVTPSLLSFLSTDCPSEEGPLFSSHYLYNLIHTNPKRKDGRPLEIIPLFLYREKNLDQVPTALRGGSIYEVWDREYRLPLSEDLTALLCRLTGQNRYEPPPPQKQFTIAPRPPRSESFI